ncbi:AAA family ATPase [Acinetobacter baumannii]|nr:AAA family ATPase [Acinetobacter baumannii]
MRLDYLKIGSAKDSPTHQFKNLKDVCIDFYEDQSITVVIGWNGTGKSNVLEALAIIFRDLIQPPKDKIPAFSYELRYEIGLGINKKYVTIQADPDLEKDKYIFSYVPFRPVLEPLTQDQSPINLVELKQPDLFSEKRVPNTKNKEDDSELTKPINVSFAKFTAENSEFLPKFVFSYYSGLSTRMHDIFTPYIEQYDKKLRGAKPSEEVGFKRMFYALPIHSQFVLLAFLFKQDETIKSFLETQLGIDPESGIESILFELKKPSWAKLKTNAYELWGAEGIVRKFLDEVYSISLAPIKFEKTIKLTPWRSTKIDHLYLFIKDIATFFKLTNKKQPKDLFRDLESTYVSELIEAVHIRVKLKKNNDTVTFKELSEGEQQLLTVLGLLRFTNEEESLYLLDEPDTHLNPKWSVEYLKYLEAFMKSEANGSRTNSHIVLTTHNPIAIAELKKEQIQILHRDEDKQIYATEPDLDPKGMGYAGIITSDMFGLGSSLDNQTNELLIEHQKLVIKPRADKTPEDKQRQKELREYLENLDFNFDFKDRIKQEFMRARFDLMHGTTYADEPIVTDENKQKALDALVKSLMKSEE